MSPLWTVELSRKARDDFDNIIRHTFENFGHHQAKRYSELIANSLRELSEQGPSHSLANDRSGLIAGIQSIPIQRSTYKARHLVFFKASTDEKVRKLVVVRILHESMDFGEHL
ncbi:type II toxin-antitoxin system RelE/ParE family toxin [Marinobacter halophilus]|uniref:Type II toxin-antitoxin system RelE/ParE family toxin n=1 Tax=Marinobacter halophilus TaxID=1323740 RepID=A0A2T1KDW5_9GAMM|nr:type II toxin-antitoxin system RelE/ParE family toxin [Marinobacter halophilus]PSF07732.1 type II toxin-antitoxin system RelE/ParE family toxin [Marinobacter halophilus]GGC56639.1 hypothetical protein GCM10011362_01190 [Marinobacter halophilus]